MANEEGPYKVSVASYKDATKYIVLKHNTVTGESWVFGKQGLEKLPEQEAVPASNYAVEIVPLLQGWFATRIDTLSGRTWSIKKGRWGEYK